MALIGVIQPNQSAPKKSTWDRVVEGITVANSVLGTAVNAGKLYNEFDQTSVNRERLGVERQLAKAQTLKATSDFVSTFEPANADEPGAVKMDLESIYKGPSKELPKPGELPKTPQYWKPRGAEIDADAYVKLAASGAIDLLNDQEALAAKEAGQPFTEMRVKGITKPLKIRIDTNKLAENFALDLDKKRADIAKTQAETANLTSTSGEGEIKKIDDLGKQRQGSETYKNAQGVIPIVRQLEDIEKDPTGATDLALITVFNKALDPTSRVTQSETDSAMASGSFGSRVQGAYESFRSGKKLDAIQRAELIAASKRLVAAHQIAGVQADQAWIAEAQNRKIDPSRIVREYDYKQGAEILKRAGQLAPELQMLQSFQKIYLEKNKKAVNVEEINDHEAADKALKDLGVAP
jgi:hypothetical protein